MSHTAAYLPSVCANYQTHVTLSSITLDESEMDEQEFLQTLHKL